MDRLTVLALFTFFIRAAALWRRSDVKEAIYAPDDNDQTRGPWPNDFNADKLCKQLQRTLMLQKCRSSSIRVLHQNAEIERALPIGNWPLRRCSLPPVLEPPPMFASLLEDGVAACSTVVFVASPTGVENAWQPLPAGSVIVVPLFANSSLVRGSDLIWQSLYQLNSRMYYSDFHNMKAPVLGLPNLQFATFFDGYAILQKANLDKDLEKSQGRFTALSRRMDSVDNHYSLLYHRNLDRIGRDEQTGVAVEIGTDCLDDRGPGKSFEFWPRYFRNLNVHLLRGESDRRCLAKWMEYVNKQGIAQVHVGQPSQSGTSNPLYSLKRDVVVGGPAGLQVVVDKDEAENSETEASFRGLFPTLAPGGLYFFEDLMSAAWGRPSNMRLDHKYSRTAFSPLAISASMAVAAAGADHWISRAEADRERAFLQGSDHDSRYWSMLETPVNWVHSMLEYVGAVSSKEKDDAIRHRAALWYQELMLSEGRMADLVECSPGICAIQRNAVREE